jgi:hypothetical protein
MDLGHTTPPPDGPHVCVILHIKPVEVHVVVCTVPEEDQGFTTLEGIHQDEVSKSMDLGYRSSPNMRSSG